MKRFVAITVIAIVGLSAKVSSRAIPAQPLQPSMPGALSIVSLNMAKEANCERVLHDLEAAPRLKAADIYLLQEVTGTDNEKNVVREMAAKLGYQEVFAQESTDVRDRGLAVLSRYPITEHSLKRLKEYNLHYHSRSRFALSTTVQTPEGALRIWNAHLDTRLNAEQRMEQLRPVLEEASKQTGPRLIGGDFNTNDLYWVGNLIPLPYGRSHGVTIRQAMEQRGFRTPFTGHLITFPSMRRHLDWIYMNQCEPVGYSVEPAPFSDHRALWASVRITR